MNGITNADIINFSVVNGPEIAVKSTYKIWMAEQQGVVTRINLWFHTLKQMCLLRKAPATLNVKIKIPAGSITSSILIIKSFSHFSSVKSQNSPNLFNNLLERLTIRPTPTQKRLYQRAFCVKLGIRAFKFLYFCAQT